MGERAIALKCKPLFQGVCLKFPVKITGYLRVTKVAVMEEEVEVEKAERVISRSYRQGFPGGAVVENLPANAGDRGSSPGLGGSHMPWSN